MFWDCGTYTDSENWYPPPKKKCPNCRKIFRPLEMIEHQKTHKSVSVMREDATRHKGEKDEQRRF